MENCATAVTAYLLKDSLPARPARTFVAQLLAKVVAAFERSSALAGADVLCFEAVVNRARSGTERSLLFLGGLTLNRLALT